MSLRAAVPRRYVHGRLIWYDEHPDERYWADHWQGQVDGPGGGLDAATDELAQLVVDHVTPDGPILEAGCGGGQYVELFRDLDWPIEGIEYAEELVEALAARRPDLPVRTGNALAIDADDATYVGYLSFGVIEHREAGPEPFLTEARRVLAPGGVAVFTVPAVGPVRRCKALVGRYRDDPDGYAFYQYAFGRRELIEAVTAAGFRLVTTRYFGASRLLDEELPGYDSLPHRRGGTRIRKTVDRLLRRRDGHMLAIVVVKD